MMYKLCKTEQSAARQRELERALSALMNVKRYEDITVSDFCTYAGIPRKAFYRYFSSKDGALYALMDHTMLEYESFREPYTSSDSRSLLRDMENFFLFWKSQKQLLDALEFSGLSGVLLERAIASVVNMTTLKRLLPGESDFVREHIAQFAISGIMIIMVNWHHDAFRESPREMAELTVRLVSKPLFPEINKLL